MTGDVLIFEAGGEVVEFDPTSWWSCSCGAATHTGKGSARMTCDHIMRVTARLPHQVADRMATAALRAKK